MAGVSTPMMGTDRARRGRRKRRGTEETRTMLWMGGLLAIPVLAWGGRLTVKLTAGSSGGVDSSGVQTESGC